MTIDELTDAIERINCTTFEVWEGENNMPDWPWVEEAIADVTARLVLRYAAGRAAEQSTERVLRDVG